MTNNIPKNILYPLPEGHFSTPAPVADQSLNVLIFEDPDTKTPYTLIINRDRRIAGETLIGYCERQIKELKRQLQDFKLVQKVVSLDANSETAAVWQPMAPEGSSPVPKKISVPAAQFASEFQQKSTYLYQRQTALDLGDERVLVLTLSGTAEFTATQRRHYQQVIESLITTAGKVA